MAQHKKLLVLDVAALGWDLVQQVSGFQPVKTIFPAVTCPVQATLRTGLAPSGHGLVANGLFFRNLRKVLFWEQSAWLVEGLRLWEEFRAAGGTVGMMFWQQSMGESVDLVVSPAPIHKHSGGMIQACYTQPAELEQRINAAVGRPFNLMNYWGPLANHRSSEWIVEAVAAVMEMPEKAPDLLFAYIPHLDYDLQRHGPGSPQASKALELLLGYLERLKAAAGERGYDWIIVGDYAIERAERAAFPNRALREAGLFGVREIAGMAYTDFFAGAAFAVCDHQFAHVHCRDQRSAEKTSEVLRAIPGVAHVLTRAEQADWGLAHANSGELVLVAERGTWFAYPWFSRDEAPDYASHVDIHNKPGYDPCELFFGWPPGSVSFDTSKIRGTHGGNGKGMEAALATSLQLASQPESHIDVAREIRGWMERFPRL